MPVDGSLSGVRERRVLIVVSSYYPALLADMQRARMLAWELPRLGWQVEVLTPRAAEVRQDAVEADSRPFFAPDTPVHEVGSLARKLFEAAGSHTHTWRTLAPIYGRGRKLLASGRFDLVYLSTTAWPYFVLGTLWRKEFGVPYVLDFHDPWVKDVPPARTGPGRWKSRGWDLLNRNMERQAVANAAGIVAVSPRYIDALKGRYPAAAPALSDPDRHAVIPFGVTERDHAPGSALATSGRHTDGNLRVAYIGDGGRIRARALSLLCRSLLELRSQGHQVVERVRFDLAGTIYGWREGDVKTLEQVAQELGAGSLVREFPARVPYRRSLELLHAADGALVLGVDDAGYMPSKLFSYALSGKPLLGSLHRQSPAYACFGKIPQMGHSLWFDREEEMAAAPAAELVARFLDEIAAGQVFDRKSALEPYLAPAMALRHAELFASCLEPTR